MNQEAMNAGRATESADEGTMTGAADHTIGALPAHPTARGFSFGRLRLCHLKSEMQMGWGHDEGDSDSRTLFELSTIYEGNRRTAVRIIAGRHAIWLFF